MKKLLWGAIFGILTVVAHADAIETIPTELTSKVVDVRSPQRRDRSYRPKRDRMGVRLPVQVGTARWQWISTAMDGVTLLGLFPTQ
jgi:hypothetical protein